MTPTQVEQVNRRLAEVVKELQQIRYTTQTDDNNSWRMLCAQVLIMIQTETKRARETMENMQSEGLSVGLVEAEGYLRGVRVIQEEFEGIIGELLDEIRQ